MHIDHPMIRRTERRDPWPRLLSEVLTLAGPRAELVRHTERAWSSVTFSGTRHTIALAFAEVEAIAQGEAYLAALPEHEFTIPAHLVADAAVVAVEHETIPCPRMIVEAELLLLDGA
ncbi:hypothetical protein SAMN05518801_10570 [Novosphingobium sp. CF614]|uniref:hypothetical protein n=1 Tax=Novosphingobium sp. CF614 TaxID=1884364 RepID=UPI0008EA7691|nr:hypothetical protein [Novosphingobium sp. CF614]SFF99519.1 hypothetical protein SAMN05518801_10570 [Novosphingobium sp. CF614]